MVRLKIDDKGKAAELVARQERNASALGWEITRDRDKPVIEGTKRPSIPAGIAEMATGDRAKDLGRVQWSYLSSVMHVTWRGVGQESSKVQLNPLVSPLLQPWSGRSQRR